MFIFLLISILFFFSAFPVNAAELFTEQFENNLSQWTVVINSTNKAEISSAKQYTGSNALYLGYGAIDSSDMIHRTFSTPFKNVGVRVFFFDNMDTSLGSMFEAKNANGDFGTGIGVNTNISAANYVYRFNSLGNTFDSGIKRTPGWHMFEIIVTDDGKTRVKIDNILLRSANDTNTSQTDVGSIYFVASWGLTGDSYYDDLQIFSATDTVGKTSKALYLEVIQTYYNSYKNVDFSQLHTATPMNGNDIASIFDTVSIFYLYGVNALDPEAVTKAKLLYMYGLANQKYATTDNWVRGAVVTPFVYSTYLLWDEIDIASQKKAFQIIEEQLYKPLTKEQLRLPSSRFEKDSAAEENAWNADFIASSINLFPKIRDAATLDDLAKCFAYHSITTSQTFATTRGDTSTYCGVTTQTVYDKNSKFQISNRASENNTALVTPLYAFTTLLKLSRGSSSYLLAGKPIPAEFKHNYEALFNESMLSGDSSSYHFLKEYTPIFNGAVDSLYYGLGSMDFMQYINPANPYYNQHELIPSVFKKKSLYYSGVASSWIPEPKFTKISTFNPDSLTDTSRAWFLDTNMIANSYAHPLLRLEEVKRPTRVIGDLDNDLDADAADLKLIRDRVFSIDKILNKKLDINRDSESNIRDLILYITNTN